jgi:hypothetical protein
MYVRELDKDGVNVVVAVSGFATLGVAESLDVSLADPTLPLDVHDALLDALVVPVNVGVSVDVLTVPMMLVDVLNDALTLSLLVEEIDSLSDADDETLPLDVIDTLLDALVVAISVGVSVDVLLALPVMLVDSLNDTLTLPDDDVDPLSAS